MIATEIVAYSAIKDEHGALELRSKVQGQTDQVFRVPASMVQSFFKMLSNELAGDAA